MNTFKAVCAALVLVFALSAGVRADGNIPFPAPEPPPATQPTPPPDAAAPVEGGQQAAAAPTAEEEAMAAFVDLITNLLAIL